ncbi:MAG: uroporphyrin-III C-methyltransferase [Hydrocarboniphaga sp.]|uniref:siroheme synthase CysG n=1 Tax=Hydrocarboniphaga sp. TaxID=2033016 RepID=UPI002624A535|nr:siroheme synthase CysG [Hydrocarboniphaga sp.]MDB5967654.1 uroporphyrin-III C-methyltransferase [Hydrocarboniphaga sp.]
MEPQAQWPPKWQFFPVFLRLRGRRVLVVGGGEVAARKLRLLAKTEALLEVVAAELVEELSQAERDGVLRHVAEVFEASQLDGCLLVIAATDDAVLNREVAAAAEIRGIAVNVVDDPNPSSFVTPSIVDRHPLLIAIATGAQAPVLGRRLREKIETMLPAAYGRLAGFMGARRARVQQTVPQADRRGLWESFLDGPGAEAVLSGAEAAADAELQHLIDGGARRGEVYLVGAGPGDPDLLTFRALRLMQQCDVVLYDALLPQAILDLVRRDAERIYVGKRRARHTLAQDQINSELVRLAREGKRVLRLKGGDPFVFGRGGEEIQRLAAAGIPFQVVPGITAANGCAAYAGIPLTHRDYAQACIFVTGHQRQDGTLDLHWDALARRGQTVVIYMGLNTLPDCCAQLIAHGLPPDWPAALIEQGTSPEQRVIVSTLDSLAAAVGGQQISGPSLVIVGEVVRLRDQLQWFAGRG